MPPRQQKLIAARAEAIYISEMLYRFVRLLYCVVFFLLPPVQAAAAVPLRIGTRQALAIDIRKQSPGSDDFIRNLVAPPFIALGQDWQWRCILCTKIPSRGDGLEIATPPKHGMVAYFEIDPKWRWQDGRPVTGHDLAYTLQQLRLSQEHPLWTSPQVLKIEVNAKTPRLFSLQLSHLRGDFFTLLAVSLLPAHRTGNTTLLSYGPYRMSQQKEQHLSLQPEAGQAAPPLEIQSYSSAEALAQAMVQGEIDMVADGQLSIGEAQSVADQLSSKQPGRTRLVAAPTQVIEHLVFNARNPVLSDPQLRHALLYAIDREQLVAKVYRNQGLRADQLYHPSDAYAAPGIKTFPYQPENAKRLLQAAGWIEQGQGPRRKGKELLRLTIESADEPERRQITEIVRQGWQAVGVELSVNWHSRDYFFSRVVARTRFRDLALVAWDQPPSTGQWLALHSREIPSADNDYIGSNIGTFSRRDVDALLYQIFRATEPQSIREASAALMGIYTAELPSLPLVFKPRVALVPSTLNPFALPGHSYSSSLYAASWRLASPAPQGLF